MPGWEDYIDNLVSHSQGHCDKVAIIGLEDGAFWTGYKGSHEKAMSDFTPVEAVHVAKNMRGDAKDSDFPTKGVVIGGIKYQFIKRENNVVYAKKMACGCMTLQTSKSAIVLGHTEEGKQVGKVNVAVDTICQYLEEQNY